MTVQQQQLEQGGGQQRQQTNTAGRPPGRHSLRERLRRRRARPDYSAVSVFVKYFLVIINMCLLLFGALCAAAGIYILVVKSKTVTSIIDFVFDPACDLCLGGLIILVIAFFGCGGSLRESICFLRIYYIVLIIFLLLEFVLVIMVFIFYFVDGAFADVGQIGKDAFLDAIKKYRDDPDMQSFIDNIQKTLYCCGASNDDEGYKDWSINPNFNCTTNDFDSCSVPFSCCHISEGENINYRCGANMLSDPDVSVINTQGCLKGVQMLLKDNIWIVGGILIGVLIPQAIIIALAKSLVSQIQQQMAKW